ncbi:MAG: NUDIX hydrolase [Planctomycetota bacterium]|jgi:ADP-ribose pyrophosphatase
MGASFDERFVEHELAFDGTTVKGYFVTVRMDDGRVVQRDYFHYTGSAVILPILDDGRIVLIRNSRFAVQEDLLELPAGRIDGGESAESAAGRELTEETGYVAGALEKLGEFYSAPGNADENLFVYLATDLSQGRQKLETYEKISLIPTAEDDVRRMIAGGEIHDAKTIAAMTLYWLRKGTC